ncbi:26766_t:CDS:1, partial [Gigaspora margarita]
AIKEGASKNSKNKSTTANVHSGNRYTCRNCFQEEHNARSCSTLCK